MDPIFDGCRLCLDPFTECFTTIDNPQLKDQMVKVFCFSIELKEGYCSGVCQSCSYAISEFYQYSEKVRQNQDILNGNVTNCDVTVDSKFKFESLKVDTISDYTLAQTTEDACVPKNEISGEEVVPTLDSKITLESVKVETFSESSLPETPEDACDPNYEDSAEEASYSDDDESYEPSPKLARTKLNDLDADEPTKNSKQTIWKIRNQKQMEEDDLFNKHFSMICNLCGASAVCYTALRSHFRQEHKRRDSYVVCCNKKLFHRYAIRDHIDFHTNPDAFRCEMCGHKFSDNDTLNAHILSMHPSTLPFKCDNCPQSFAQEFALVQHMKRHVKVKCPECNNTFSCKGSLSRHMTRQHSGKDRALVCHTCGKEFPNKESFDRHMNEHIGIDMQRIQCGICQLWLKNRECFRNHMNWVHADGNQQVQCDICLQKYPHNRALQNHKKTHAEPMYVCEFCGKKLKTAITLKEHRTTHTGEEKQRFQCEICQRWLKGKRSFRNHMNCVHPDGNQVFQCDVCLLKYPHAEALSRHKSRTHAEPKHECEFCGKRFKKAISLKEHRAAHTGEVLYTCEYCGIPKNFRTTLYDHIKQQHPMEWAQKKLEATQGSIPS